MEENKTRGGHALASTPPPTRTSDRMADILSPYHDRPKDWIRDNQSRLALLLQLHGDTAVLAALEACLDAGKLDFFFQDFGRYKPSIKETEHGERPRCPGCGDKMRHDTMDNLLWCGRCRRMFRPDLTEIGVPAVDTGALALPWRRA